MLRNYLNLWFILCVVLCASAVNIANAGEKVHLIWQIRDHFWETEWVKEVLSQVDYHEIKDGNYKILRDRSIIVVSKPNEVSNAYFAKLRRLNYKFAIIHLSDERYRHNTDFYEQAQFVLRNLWHKKFLSNPKVSFFPLGYKRGFWDQWDSQPIPAASQRKYAWSFAGQIKKKPTRAKMIENMESISPHLIYETFAFSDPNSLSTVDYRQLMLDTIFIPCPTGWWNLDSFRVYEALECGCIPIVEKQPLDYFRKFFPDHPFIAVDSWDQAPQQIKLLMDNPAELEKRRQQCYQWWQKYKKTIKKTVADLVNQLMQIA